jgi:hypothetical protein
MVIIAYLTSSFPVIAADFENMEVSTESERVFSAENFDVSFVKKFLKISEL